MDSLKSAIIFFLAGLLIGIVIMGVLLSHDLNKRDEAVRYSLARDIAENKLRPIKHTWSDGHVEIRIVEVSPLTTNIDGEIQAIKLPDVVLPICNEP